MQWEGQLLFKHPKNSENGTERDRLAEKLHFEVFLIKYHKEPKTPNSIAMTKKIGQ
jgi:hypothetical protein